MNQTTETTTQKPTSINYAVFYRLCKELEARKQDIQERRPTRAQLAQEMSQVLNATVGIGTIRQACESTGITWKPRRDRTQKASDKKLRERAACILAQQLIQLRRELGTEIPAILSDTLAALQYRQDYIPRLDENSAVQHETNGTVAAEANGKELP